MQKLGVQGNLVALFNHMKTLEQFYNHTEVFDTIYCRGQQNCLDKLTNQPQCLSHLQESATEFLHFLVIVTLFQKDILDRYRYIINERVHPKLSAFFANLSSLPQIK